MDIETKLDRINRWMMLAANIGVLLGIIFLVFELRQNTLASRTAAASNFQDTFSEVELFIAQDAAFAELLEAGRDGETLSGADGLRLTVFYGNVLRTWQNAYYQYRAGSLHADLWRGSQSRLATIMSQDQGLLDYWTNNQSQYTPAFNAMVAQVIEANASD